MRVYTDEYIKAISKIEEDMEMAISKWIIEIGSDSMIESRDISIGDTFIFKGGFTVLPKEHNIDISNEMHWSMKNTTEDVSKRVCKKVIHSLQELIEKQIENSDTPITRIKDVRKFIKVVYSDSIIMVSTSSVSVRIGIEEYKLN